MANETHPTRTASIGTERKLAAILSADVKGYSRLMGEDEVGTLRTLTAYRKLIDARIAQHRGRIVGTAGDSVLAEFASVVDAVQCAVEMQTTLRRENATLPLDRRMEFRIGINLGDVMVEGEQIYGDGVNIAARMESLAEPGGICISGTVHEHTRNKLSLQYEDLGEQQVKNIAEPVRVWRVVIEPIASGRDEVTSPLPSEHVRALPLPDKPSIVVLPFVNLSSDPEQEYFSDGITEDLTSSLSQLSGLFVIARNSAFTYKGKAVKVQEVSKELGVRYVLEGSVRKAGNRVRVTAQLIDATTSYHLWSERYDRELRDIFALQDELVQKIVTTLKLQLTLQEQGFIVRKHTDNLEAYDAFLRGAEYYWRLTKEAITVQARQLWEKAIALDPQYAEAYAWLSGTYYLEWGWRWSADPQTLERALALAQQAVALDDSLPAAHSFLSLVYAQKQQSDQAIAAGERAIALDPNHADSYEQLAEALSIAGRPEDALRRVEQAMRLNPHYPPIYLFESGLAYYYTGRYAEAITTLQELISRSPNLLTAHVLLASSYRRQWVSQQSPAAQTLEPAMAAIQRALALNDSFFWNHINLGNIYLYQQRYEQALAEMERAVAFGPTEAASYAYLAEVLSRVGRTEEALEAAAQALRLKPDLGDEYLAGVGAAYAVAGRYEEALVPLQRYLSRHPNFLPAHLTLAAVYSELGQVAEARAEAAEVLRLNPNFSLEVHRQRAPIKDPAVLERQLAALRKAGLK
jgi:adenylate cyclase